VPTYEPLFKRHPEVDDLPIPNITDYCFRCPLDVVDYAPQDRTIRWATWPDVWHLDANGRFRCYCKATSLDGLRHWAEERYGLHRSRREGLRAPRDVRRTGSSSRTGR
jgi:hypothetical protein